MTASPKKAPAPSRLIYVDDSLPGITRQRAGRGWCYRDPKGERITDREEIDRLNAIALPPAYTDCWFCPAPNGHILATGYDARGRKQYRYHPEFRAMRESEKFDCLAEFGKLLPLLRERVEDDLGSEKLSHDHVVASVLRLLDTGQIRIGNECYTKENKSYGATTLRKRHVRLRGRRLVLRFKAKGGKPRELEITDKNLKRFVRDVQDLPGQHLFQYLDDDGEQRPIGSCDVNDYIRETMGEAFTAKHFRTWHASAIAFRMLAGATDTLTIKDVMEEVCELLGNTPAIARKSYVHPEIIDLIDMQDEWRESLRLPRKTRWLSRHERGLIEFLEGEAKERQDLAA
jgi:DNA topoisomerase I